jgi:hypothetical protein
MSKTTSITAASQVALSTNHLGICNAADFPAGSLEVANRLLQKNHDENHIFWRDVNGHNHMAHCMLTMLALGATPTELERAFADSQVVQRPPPDLDLQVVKEMYDDEKFYERMHQGTEYSNFLVFFEQQIEAKGWKAVVDQYCFSRTKVADAVLAGLYEGAYHPIIHFGLGVEFEQTSIIAEGLAQAAAHNSANIDRFLFDSEKEADALKSDPSNPTKSLVQLLLDVRADKTIKNGPVWTDFANKLKDGVLGRAGKEIASLAAQYRVKPEELEQKAAETINCAAYTAGGAQRAEKVHKIDFFHMHDVTSSIFITVLLQQPWISIENKVRLVEWKGRLDLVWYAASGSAELDIETVTGYEGLESAGMDWGALYKAVNATRDDGHVGKFIRALKNGEEVSKKFEHGEGAEKFPVKGDMWLKLARMAYDSTLGLSPEAKWIWATGFDQAWGQVPLRK